MIAGRSESTDADAIAHTDDAVTALAAAWVRAGYGVALATVVETWGSAPRPVGSRSAVRADGLFAGSVSGGCVEGEVVTEALEAIAQGQARMVTYGVADAVAWRAGLSCGGEIVIRIEPIVEGVFAPELLFAIVAALEARRATIRVVDLTSGAERLVQADALPEGDPITETCAAVFAAGASRRVETGAERRFFALAAPAARVCIVGAVHIAQSLAPMAAMIGLDVTVIDPRAAFLEAPRFARFRSFTAWPVEVIGRDVLLDPATAVVALAHRPDIDDPALIAALRAGCFYVGALGSRKSHARRVERLVALKIEPAMIERIRAPIGLDIGAAGPAEIAVSVLAEIVAAMRRGPVD